MSVQHIFKSIFNSDISVETFLKEYWNKKPLLIKNAYPSAANIATLEDFQGLALDEDFETRVVHKDSQGKRKMLHGPFEEDQLQELAKKPYALLCHNLNTLAPEFYAMEEAVGFIPKWEFDDVMSVYSNKEMSLGAHIDNYNVFIIQGQGKRLWEIQESPKVSWRSDEEIKVLQEFTPDYAYELSPGDMIYIPPGVAHHGISIEESASYSIGFKSLETVDSLGEFMADLKQGDEASSFFKNQSFNQPGENQGSLSDVNEDVFKFLQEELSAMLCPGGQFRQWLFEKLSRPKFPIHSSKDPAPASYQEMQLQRDVYLKYSAFDEQVCVNGQCWKLSAQQREELFSILNTSPFEEFSITEKQESLLKEILDKLFEDGCIFPVYEEE